MSEVSCPICGRVCAQDERSVECDEPRCPLKSQTSVLQLLAAEVGVPVPLQFGD